MLRLTSFTTYDLISPIAYKQTTFPKKANEAARRVIRFIRRATEVGSWNNGQGKD